MVDRKKQNPVEWEAAGAEYAVWEAMLELERHEADAGEEHSRCSSVCTRLSKCTAHSGLELENVLQIPIPQSRVLCG